MVEKGASVYIVDDDESVCRAIARLLKLNGYTPHHYVSAKEFLENFNRGDNSVIICDFLMPEMSGLELLKKLQKLKFSHSFILISATINEAIVREVKHLNIVFIEKPVDSNDLMRAIANS
jgi:FixJ family two-component response regulator